MTDEQLHAAILEERKATGYRGRAKAAPGGTVKQIRLGGANGIGGQELYDRLSQLVCYHLVKTRYIDFS